MAGCRDRRAPRFAGLRVQGLGASNSATGVYHAVQVQPHPFLHCGQEEHVENWLAETDHSGIGEHVELMA
ncbi:MAG: hypothetical protein ACLQIB_26045 [Isosphaeraceae bacterium]